jgi:hypothetical protein
MRQGLLVQLLRLPPRFYAKPKIVVFVQAWFPISTLERTDTLKLMSGLCCGTIRAIWGLAQKLGDKFWQFIAEIGGPLL